MTENQLLLLTLITPLLFTITALSGRLKSNSFGQITLGLSKLSASIGLVVAIYAAVIVWLYGTTESATWGYKELGVSFRLDVLSMLMFMMISIIGFIVVRFSFNYLDGDQRQAVFMSRLAATIASVQLLVLSGNTAIFLISWILTSLTLHKLLIFYPDRPGAIIAARKKFIMARLADVCLLIAFIGLYVQYGTGNLGQIFDEISSGIATQSFDGSAVGLAAIFIVMAALLKSAQFPTHGWLIEVMETPTPVSALLHAGLLNAGPYLILRMAHVIDANIAAGHVLLVVGGITALFASVVFLTQTSIKTALSYSSVAHMGFSLMICGLGVYPAAMLHLMAHSFYKAHAFLSSGSTIEALRLGKISPLKRQFKLSSVFKGISLSLLIYAGIMYLWGISWDTNPGVFIIGVVIALGMSSMMVTIFDSKWNPKLFVQVSLRIILIVLAFFSLETSMKYLIDSQIPAVSMPTLSTLLITSGLLIFFAAAVIIQMVGPSAVFSRYFQPMAIHIRNGLYANAVLDRIVNALYIHSPESREILNKEIKWESDNVDSPLKTLKEQVA